MRFHAVCGLMGVILFGGSGVSATEEKLPAKERDQIMVQLSCAKAEAIERTLAAFVGESLHVAKSEEGIVTAVPVPVTLTEGMFKGMLIGTITYSATVIGLSDTSSQVILGATMRNPETSEITVISSDMSKHWTRPKDKAKFGAMYAPFWQRLERMASRLQNREPLSPEK